MKKILGYFFIAIMGGAAATGFNSYFEEDTIATPALIQNSIPSKPVNMSTYLPENTVDFTGAANMSVHAVVHVKTVSEPISRGNQYYDPFFGFWGNPQQPSPQLGAGSGVIISSDGYIVTNNHVINGADKIEVILNDKRTYIAEVIGTDPATDLALLKIKEQNLHHLAYGNSDEVKVGEWVLAVGNPFNLTSTVTAGIVSAKARNINIIQNNNPQGLAAVESFIQTDAAVNPGNSGGALVNTSGQLVGINSAIASNTGSYTGYSFAIPVNIVRKVVADLLEFGEVQRAFIGVSIRDLDASLAKEKGISGLNGVYVEGIAEGGAAQEAGVKEGDIITRIGEVTVNNVPELQEQVSRFRPGEKVMVSLRRDNSEKTFAVVLKNKDGSVNIVKKEPKPESLVALGATFEPLSENDKKKLNIEYGLRITKLSGGKLRGAGIREGFVITGIDKKKINTLDDVKIALENKRGGVLIEGVYPNGMKAYYGFGL